MLYKKKKQFTSKKEYFDTNQDYDYWEEQMRLHLPKSPTKAHDIPLTEGISLENKRFHTEAFKQVLEGNMKLHHVLTEESDAVRVLQDTLIELGYGETIIKKGDEKGHFMMGTAYAVARFQIDHDLDYTQQVDAKTLKTLDKALGMYYKENNYQVATLKENDPIQAEENVEAKRGYFEKGDNGKTYFVVITPVAIEKGDPNQIAEFLFYKQFIYQIGRVDVPNDKLWELVGHKIWKNDYFPKVNKAENEKTTTFRVSVDYDIRGRGISSAKDQENYKSAIRIVYRNTNTLTQWYYDNFSEWLFKWDQDFTMQTAHKTLDLLSKLSQAEATFLKAHIQSLSEHTQSSYYHIYQIIQQFSANPLRFMSNAGAMENGHSMLETYTSTGDPEKNYQMLELAKKLDVISPELAQKYISDKNAFFDAFSTTTNEKDFEKQLSDLGLSTDEIRQFLELFKLSAIGKAFTMLRQSEAAIDSETAKYTSDPAQLDEVASIIKGERKGFNKAAKKIASDFGKILDVFKTEHLGLVGVKEDDLDELASQVGGAEFAKLISKMVQMHYANGDPLALITISDEGQAFLSPRELLGGVYQFMVAYINFYAQHAEAIVKNIKSNHNLVHTIAKQKKDNTFNPRAFTDQYFSDLATGHKEFSQALTNISALGKEKEYLVLRDLTFNFRSLSLLSKKEIKKHILKTLKAKKENIQKVRADLNDDPNYIWKLGPLLEFTLRDVGIPSSSTAARLVIDKSGDAFRNDMYVSLTIGVLSLALAIGGFFTGGATWLGLGLFATSLGLGVADVVIEYNRYQSAKAANNTSLDPEAELANMNSGSLGLVFAIAGLFLDLLEAIKIVKALNAANKLAGSAEASTEALYTMLKEQGKLADVSLAQFKAQLQLGSKRSSQLAEAYRMIRDPKFNTLLNAASNIPLNDITKTGLYRLYTVNKKAFEQALKTGKLSPDILTRLGIEMVARPHVSNSFVQIVTRFGSEPEALANILRYWTGFGSKYIDDLPDILKVLDGITDDQLAKTILTDYDFVAKLFAENGDNALTIIKNRWANWIDPKKSYKSKTFKEFVEKGGNDILKFSDSDSGAKTIAEHFEGQADILRLFESTTEHTAKNLKLWERTEELLVQAYTKGDVLPDNVQKAIDSIVNTNLIGKSGLDSNIKYTAGKVVEAMNKTIARNSTITDILRLDELGLKIHQGSRGSIFEEWVRHNHSLGKLGAEEWGELQGKLTFSLEDLKYLDAFKNFKGTRIIADTHYLDNGATILIEFKHVTGKLSGEPLEQMRNYKKLIDAGKIDEVEYVFSTLEAARKNEDLLEEIFIEKELYTISYINKVGQKLEL